MKIQRRSTRVISVGSVEIGGHHPIAIQSMCNKKTEDTVGVINQIHELEALGCDLIRVTVNTNEAALALPLILRDIHIPLICDIHFDYKLALQAMEYPIACIRINPGNIGAPWKIIEVIKKARDTNKAIRIGVNAGSLEKDILKKYGHPVPEALVESALKSIEFFESENFFNFKISIKSSDVLANYEAYTLLSQKTDYPFHLGLTESGTKEYGTVKSSVGLGALLLAGIGDTIRVSLSTQPHEEIKVARYILKSLGLRNDAPEVIACPSCGRADIDVYKLAEEVEMYALTLKKNIKIAVMGCVVNGPGESMEADIGIAGGKGEGLVYKKGKAIKKVPEKEMLEYLMKEIECM